MVAGEGEGDAREKAGGTYSVASQTPVRDPKGNRQPPSEPKTKSGTKAQGKVASAAPESPARPDRKRKAPAAAEGGASGSTKKKKKTTTGKYHIPARVEATPRKGPAGYGAGIYRTPLDEPTVLGMLDKGEVLEMFARVREVRERVRYDFGTMRKSLVNKGWWSADDLAEGPPDQDDDSIGSVEDVLSSADER
jgi:hypothetical protein